MYPMTETAREADYVLPASSQYEKWESTFFQFLNIQTTIIICERLSVSLWRVLWLSQRSMRGL